MKPLKWLHGPLLPLLFLLLVLLLQLFPGFLLSLGRAQGSSTALQVGQRVPALTAAPIVNAPFTAARLSDFEGKLLLLEFWAPWCGGCKASMPKVHALQKEFSDRLQVLLVTRNSEDEVKAFFRRWKNPDGSPFELPSVVGDTSLSALFPYRFVPHFVWVGPDGLIKAITTTEHVTAATVQLALEAGVYPESLKVDMDPKRPLFSSPYLPEDKLEHFSILLKGKVDGLNSGSHYRQQDGKIIGRAITNQPLLRLYEIVAQQQLIDYNRNYLVLDVPDKQKPLAQLNPDSAKESELHELYSYDLLLPPAAAGQLYRYMLEDLNRYTPYEAAIERRTTTCLVLQLTGNPRQLKSKGGPTESTLHQPGPKHLRNAPMLYLTKQLLSEPAIHLPVLDETGYTGPVDLKIGAELSDLPALRRELRRYHLDLVEAERPIDMLVIRQDKALP